MTPAAVKAHALTALARGAESVAGDRQRSVPQFVSRQTGPRHPSDVPNCARTSSAARTVVSICSLLCAVDRKAASNWDGAR